MKTELYTIYDSVAQVHNKPFHQTNRNVAIRTTADLTNDPTTEVSKNPEHYSLFYLGTYDDTNASLELAEPMEHVLNCTELVQQ
ncbi:nonstructural protein [Microviridae sp.]|nr:nonstructural protein [Microviridae sp.]